MMATATPNFSNGVFAGLLVVLLSVSASSSQSKPNIVILFADNLSYADVFGTTSSQKTPNIHRLATRGIRLNNWNSAAHLCSASRASLLTGKYPVRLGVYPGVFKPDSENGLLPQETTLAEHLKEEGYATAIVGKWHLGHRPDFLPTNQGFDEWLGVPYHMSGGSLDNHTCSFDRTETMWLPLYEGTDIVQQPVRVDELAERYANRSADFILLQAAADTPFFLYVAFSHVHQLCAPRDFSERESCQWVASGETPSFASAVEEMDWIAGRILEAIDQAGVADDTLVLFTSDNGPWVAERSCSGLKGPFEGRWLRNNVARNCTACPHDYVPNPTVEQPRRCVLPGTEQELEGVHCGEDSGLGSVWEANLRMPAVARWPGKIPPGIESMSLISTLDVVPTILCIVLGKDRLAQKGELFDGIDASRVLLGQDEEASSDNRTLFFWRDGFLDGPLGPPYGKFDVAAAKHGRLKLWFWTKSAHYNDDVEVHHDPPLLFDVSEDPAEGHPLDPRDHEYVVHRVRELTDLHKADIGWTYPLTLARDDKYVPCADRQRGCRTHQDLAKNHPLTSNHDLAIDPERR